MPLGAELSFRGWCHDSRLAAFTTVTQTIVASSAAMEIGTAGFSTGNLAIVVARSGRDLRKLSAMPEAAEVTLPPGVIFRVHEAFDLAGMNARAYEELTVDDSDSLVGMGRAEEDVIRSVRDILAKARGAACRFLWSTVRGSSRPWNKGRGIVVTVHVAGVRLMKVLKGVDHVIGFCR